MYRPLRLLTIAASLSVTASIAGVWTLTGKNVTIASGLPVNLYGADALMRDVLERVEDRGRGGSADGAGVEFISEGFPAIPHVEFLHAPDGLAAPGKLYLDRCPTLVLGNELFARIRARTKQDLTCCTHDCVLGQ